MKGDALARWYQRSPDEVEQNRRTAEAQRYSAFFGGTADTDPDPGFSDGFESPSQEIDPGFVRKGEAPAQEVDPGFTWVPAGPNRWRGVRIHSDNVAPTSVGDAVTPNDGAIIDRGGAGPDDGARLIDTGNPATRGTGDFGGNMNEPTGRGQRRLTNETTTYPIRGRSPTAAQTR